MPIPLPPWETSAGPKEGELTALYINTRTSPNMHVFPYIAVTLFNVCLTRMLLTTLRWLMQIGVGKSELIKGRPRE